METANQKCASFNDRL